MKLMAICGLLLLPLVVRADQVELANGQAVKGRVLTYWNGTFEVAGDGGEVFRYPQAKVKRIVFDGAAVVLDTRTQGRVEGTITVYENAGFSLQTADGKTQRVAATFVKEVSFGGASGAGGGGGGGGSGAGEASSGGGGSSKKIATITHGARVDVAKALARGQVTIVDFYADWCGPCRQISPVLEKLAKEDPDVVLRKVDIIKWGSPVAEQYGINSIPHIEIYDRQAKLVGTVVGVSPDEVRQYVKQAKNGGK